MSGSSDKTEKPTAKKLADARKEGQTARSPDVAAWLMLLAATVVVPITGRHASQALQNLLMLAAAGVQDPTTERAVSLLGLGLRDVFVLSAPIALTTVAVALAAGLAQGGLHPATKRLKPKASHLNPYKGIKRLVGPITLWEAAKVLLKTGALGLVLWSVVRRVAPELVALGSAPLGSTLSTTGGAVLALVRASVVAGLVMAMADYLVQRRRIDKQLRMSKHDVKQEMKQSEGDANVKGAIRSRQLAMSRNRMMSDLASADVVVVNPTHVAVALRYEPGAGAPTVVAKGRGAVATKIRERATEARVPLVQNVPLARALDASCEIGQEIPASMYAAVARVLAFVMALRAKGAAAGIHRQPGVPQKV